jgi:ATPase subunit of ABC transporter with duplicated ATPase domains
LSEYTEQTLSTETALVVQQAQSFAVTTNEQYEAAGAFLTTIKSKAKAVVDFFADSKAKALAAHRAICESEKKLLDPLKDAESVLKRAMGAYQTRVQEEQRKAAEEARRRQQEEAERLAREAVAAEEKGDAIGAEIAMHAAAMIEDMKPAVVMETPKAAGVSTRMKWVADVTDPQAVPAYVNGIEVRPIDTGALVKLAQLSNGTLSVPGVKFRQEAMITARAR